MYLVLFCHICKKNLSTEAIMLKTNLFKKVISQTFFATSKNESRPILTGINFRIDGNLMEVIATDSYRLAKKSIQLDRLLDTNINISQTIQNEIFDKSKLIKPDIISPKLLISYG